MDIQFKCPGCKNEMSVSDEMAGKRGTCPRCGRIITVPSQSENTPVFAPEKERFFRVEHLNRLLEALLEEYDTRIIGSRVRKNEESDVVVLEIAMKKRRSQIIALNGNDRILVASTRIGINPEPIGFNDILVDLAINFSNYPTYSAYVDKNNDGCYEIGLRRADRVEHIDREAFYDLTIRLAELADSIEAQHYDNDVN